MGRSAAARGDLETLFRTGGTAGLTEADLLHRFAADRDEAAFRALVARHGPRVLGVCRGILRDDHAADDAFQATFLVLAQRAGAIGRPERLGGWLAGVARRVARKARRAAARRSDHEQRAARYAAGRSGEPAVADRFEVAAVLAEELDRLPEGHRRAVVLCCLEGKTTDEAAQLLGWPRGTVGTRVARGRKRLRDGLLRRGVAPALALVAAPRLPEALANSTVRAAGAFAARNGAAAAAAGTVPAKIVALARAEVGSQMITSMIRKGTILLAMLLGGGMAAWGYGAFGGRPGEPAGRAKAALAAPADDRDALQGTWVVVEGTAKGAPSDLAEHFTALEMTFKDDRLELVIPGVRTDQARYSLDASANPKRLTLATAGEDGPLMTWIYALEGDRLRLAFLPEKPGTAPGNFDAPPPEGGKTMVVLQLVPKAKAPKLDPARAAQLEKGRAAARQAASRAISVNNLKQICLAMHNYANTHGDAFPPAAITDQDGKPLLSWRVAILPYIEEQALYQQFHLDEPWDSAHNKTLIEKMPKLYAPVNDVQTPEPGMTFYQVLVGNGAFFDVAKPTKLAEIIDGVSNTLLVVEAADPVIWTRPDDLAFNPAGNPPGFGGLKFDGGFNAAFADGSVKFLKDTIDPKVLRALITRSGGEVIGQP
jgi:RNA polymerase sigma factor (sigma-70 family)